MTYSIKILQDILTECDNQGGALLDLLDAAVIVRLREIVEASQEELTRITNRENVTEGMWEDYNDLTADLRAAQHLLRYLGAGTGEDK